MSSVTAFRRRHFAGASIFGDGARAPPGLHRHAHRASHDGLPGLTHVRVSTVGPSTQNTRSHLPVNTRGRFQT